MQNSLFPTQRTVFVSAGGSTCNTTAQALGFFNPSFASYLSEASGSITTPHAAPGLYFLPIVRRLFDYAATIGAYIQNAGAPVVTTNLLLGQGIRLYVKSWRNVLTIKNNANTGVFYELYRLRARRDILALRSTSGGATVNVDLNTDYMNQPLSVMPSNVAGSETAAAAVIGVTPYDIPPLCQHFKITRCEKFFLRPGVTIQKVVSSKKNRLFRSTDYYMYRTDSTANVVSPWFARRGDIHYFFRHYGEPVGESGTSDVGFAPGEISTTCMSHVKWGFTVPTSDTFTVDHNIPTVEDPLTIPEQQPAEAKAMSEA